MADQICCTLVENTLVDVIVAVTEVEAFITFNLSLVRASKKYGPAADMLLFALTTKDPGDFLVFICGVNDI